MHDLDRIEQGLAAGSVDPARFERCAQDILSELYSDLVPIPGGTDWGRDAEILKGAEEERTGLLATVSRDLEGVRKNMLSGIRSMKDHGIATRRIVLANPGNSSQLDRESLRRSAASEGFELDEVFDRSFFASKLRRDGYWRKELLGLSSEPITLSRVAPDLAESPWAQLPLVARGADVTAVQGCGGDQVITGPPGVGKTRLLQEVPGAVFVDKDAGLDQVFDDLRWLTPDVVVVDDSHNAEALVNRLVWARNSEPDVFTYRVIAVCWPDEVETVRSWLVEADVHEVSLLERTDMDALIVSMGITNELARSEILGQAEGRPGWAVALSDLLLRARDAESLLRGSALFGEVSNYLKRSGLSPDTVNVLTIISALGGIHEGEIERAAEELGIARGEFARLLTSAARSGLIDVGTQYIEAHKNVRCYQVRPPMLADVLVAETVFRSDVPVIDLEAIANRWSEHLGALTEAAIDSVLLGQVEARPVADALYELAIACDDLSDSTKNNLVQCYARIDHSHAQIVLEQLWNSFEELIATDGYDPWRLEPILADAALIAGWYHEERAVRLLLDAAVLDARETNPNPGHPLRKLADLVHDFHPELEPPREQRDLIARVARAWLDEDPHDHRWRVFGEQAVNVLSLGLNSARSAPGNPRTFHLAHAVVDAAEVERIYVEVWPPLRERLRDAPPQVIARVIAVAEDWLRIGGGYDQPFGNAHPVDRIAAAKSYGERLLHDLGELTAGSPGLQVAIRSAAERFGVEMEVHLESDDAAFFEDIDRKSDWQAATTELRESIAEAIHRWPEKGDPPAALRRLHGIRDQLEVAGVPWPDRVFFGCLAIADSVEDPLTWIDSALAEGLAFEAGPFIDRTYAVGQRLGEEGIDELLGDRRARATTVERVLAHGAEEDQLHVVSRIGPADYMVLQTLFLREELDTNTTRTLLTNPDPSARACAAAAMFYERPRDNAEWSPGDCEAAWLEAISCLDMVSLPGFRDYEAGELTEFLAKKYPDTLLAILERTFQEALDRDSFSQVLPHPAWDAIHHLPHSHKDALWTRFASRPVMQWLFMKHLVGTDEEWLALCVESGRISPDRALEAYSGFGPQLAIEQLARLLVSRGVDPKRIAGVAMAGSWVGEESDHFASLVTRFEALAASEDASVASVGRAGVEIYSEAQQRAEAAEHKKRIQGEL